MVALPENQSTPLWTFLAGLGKDWRREATFILVHGYGGSSRSPCGYSCTLCVESIESLKSLGTELVVLTSRPIVVWETSLLS